MAPVRKVRRVWVGGTWCCLGRVVEAALLAPLGSGLLGGEDGKAAQVEGEALELQLDGVG